MNKLGLLLLSIVGVAALTACQQKGAAESGAATSESPAVAVVDGVPISRSLYDFYIMRVAGRTPADLTAEERSRALDGLIRAQLLAEQADKDGLTKDPDTENLLQLSKFNVLEQVVSESYLKDRKPSEEQLRTEYETQVSTMPHTEYHARHILVATEPFAERIIDQLNHGANFEDLAKRESMDSSKTNGGDLGWFTTQNMVKPFADAVVQLKPGEFTQKPVHTQYGWHVIQLVETRPVTPPSFDSAQQRLVQLIEAREFTSYVDGLEKNAKIEKSLPSYPAPSSSSSEAGAPAAPQSSAAP